MKKIYRLHGKVYWLFVCFTVVVAGLATSLSLVEGANYSKQQSISEKDLSQSEVLYHKPFLVQKQSVAHHSSVSVPASEELFLLDY
jgi:hypothetical protein